MLSAAQMSLNHCSNRQSVVSGDDFNVSDFKSEFPHDFIYIINGEAPQTATCHIRSELREVLDSQSRVYSWIPKKSAPDSCCAFLFQPRFKLPLLGLFVDSVSYINLLKQNSVYVALYTFTETVGRGFGISNIHNRSTKIYQLVPLPAPLTTKYFNDELKASDLKLMTRPDVHMFYDTQDYLEMTRFAQQSSIAVQINFYLQKTIERLQTELKEDETKVFEVFPQLFSENVRDTKAMLDEMQDLLAEHKQSDLFRVLFTDNKLPVLVFPPESFFAQLRKQL